MTHKKDKGFKKIKNKKMIEDLFLAHLVYKQKKVHFYYQVSPPGDSTVNAAFTVPKKTVPLAVNRNKIKRQMREALKEALKDYTGSGLSMFIIFRGNKNTTFLDLVKEIDTFLYYIQKKYG